MHDVQSHARVDWAPQLAENCLTDASQLMISMQSVLQQTTNHLSKQMPTSPGKTKLYSLPEQCGEVTTSSLQRNAHVCTSCGMCMPGSAEYALEALSLSASVVPLTTPPPQSAASDAARPKPMSAAIKKQGVSAESCVQSMQQSYSAPIPKYDKDFR